MQEQLPDLLIRLWLSIAIVKTLVGYAQMPVVVRVLKKKHDRNLGVAEILQMLVLSPLVLVVAWPYFLVKEKFEFFYLYNEEDVEEKLKEMGQI